MPTGRARAGQGEPQEPREATLGALGRGKRRSVSSEHSSQRREVVVGEETGSGGRTLRFCAETAPLVCEERRGDRGKDLHVRGAGSPARSVGPEPGARGLLQVTLDAAEWTGAIGDTEAFVRNVIQ